MTLAKRSFRCRSPVRTWVIRLTNVLFSGALEDKEKPPTFSKLIVEKNKETNSNNHPHVEG